MSHIIFLTRGHGYGHAAKDHQIIDAICQIRPDIRITIASSGSGLEYYTQKNIVCTDLGIPDNNDQSYDAAYKVLSFLLRTARPDLVIADEVFCAPAICRRLGFTNLLLTHWFFSEVGSPSPNKLYDGANAVLILDFPEAHKIPENLNVQVHFTGAIAKEFSLTQDQARAALALPSDSQVILASFGSIVPIKLPAVQIMLRNILLMWKKYAHPSHHLLILASSDHFPEFIRLDANENIQWIGMTTRPMLYYAAADAIISYATFTTLCDLVCNRKPVIAIVGSLNPVDSLHAKFFESTKCIQSAKLEHLEPDYLWSMLREALKTGSQHKARPEFKWGTPLDIARFVISRFLNNSISE